MHRPSRSITVLAMSEDFNALIPELPEWNDGRGVDPLTWIECVGNYELAVGYSLLFWPRFAVIDDYVLRAATRVETLRGWQREGYDRAAIEAVINHVHMADVHNDAEPTEAQLRYLGRVLKQTHELKLAADFPERRFVVSFSDEPDLDVMDYELTFWQADA